MVGFKKLILTFCYTQYLNFLSPSYEDATSSKN